VNYTYYRMPTRATMTSLLDKSEGRLRFAVKLTDVFTHKRTAGTREADEFRAAVEPLAEAGKLGCLLAQFPYSFKATRKSLRHLTRLAADFQDLPLVVEVRNRDWVCGDFFAYLKEHSLGFCCVDEPDLKGLLPPLDMVTSPVGYVRFHGRNREKWWRHDRPEERYDYRYGSEELREWVPRLRRMEGQCQELFVFFNNHFEGKAVQNASDLLDMLARVDE